MTGVGGVLHADGDGWSGMIEAYSDVGGVTRYERPVTLSRVDCSSPPPDGLPTYERPRHEPGVALATVGLFAHADTLVVVSRSGRVGMLQIDWLPPATPDAILARLSAAYGEPSVWRWPIFPNETDTVPESQRPIAGYFWDGRITQIHISPSTGGGFRVSLSDPRIC